MFMTHLSKNFLITYHWFVNNIKFTLRDLGRNILSLLVRIKYVSIILIILSFEIFSRVKVIDVIFLILIMIRLWYFRLSRIIMNVKCVITRDKLLLLILRLSFKVFKIGTFVRLFRLLGHFLKKLILMINLVVEFGIIF